MRTLNKKITLVFLISLIGYCKDKNLVINPSEKIVIVEIDDHSIHEFGGYPLPRSFYVKLLSSIKKLKPTLIFLDVFFIKKPRSKKDNFASEINKNFQIITDFLPSNSAIEVNYDDNQDYIGLKIKARRSLNDSGFISLSGLEFPYPSIVKKNKSVCLSLISFEEDNHVRSMEFYAYYKHFLYENSQITILNEYLQKQNLYFGLSDDDKSFDLYEVRNNKKFVRKTIASRDSESEDLTHPIYFSKLRTVSARDIINNQTTLESRLIFLVGYNAGGIGDKWTTPAGLMPGIQLIGQQVNTLLYLIKDET